MPNAEQFKVRVTNVRATSELAAGRVVRHLEYTFFVGGFGPFTLQFPESSGVEERRREIEEKAQKVRESVQGFTE